MDEPEKIIVFLSKRLLSVARKDVLPTTLKSSVSSI